eukprot:m.637521 g.637521  ORF g.637521 m.637521 type:complete len:647 (-) comp22601_c0_seq1:1246-3186(-)
MALRLCGVCGTSGVPGIRPLFVCGGKGCDLCVHRECYGIPDDHPEQRKWYCKRCEPFSMIRSTKVKCFACPQKAGALKSVQHETFCHVVCALWLESVQVLSLSSTSGISVGLDKNKGSGAAGATAVQCYICQSRNKGKEIASFGRMRKCHHKGCERYMHITCAQEEKQLVIPFHDGKLDLRDEKAFVVACKLHPSAAVPRQSSDSTAELPGIIAPDGTVIRVGDGVKAYWKGGRDLYEGTVCAIDTDGETCSINYHDGDFESGVPRDRIRPMLMVRQAKQMATKTMAKQAKVAKKGTGPAVSTKSPSSSSVAARASTHASESAQATAADKGKTIQSRNSDDAVGGAAARRRSSTETSPNNQGKGTSLVKSPPVAHGGSAGEEAQSGASRVRRAGVSTDPECTPAADKFAAALKQFARDDLQAVTKYLLRGSSSNDANLLNKLEKAVSNRERLERRLDETSAEQADLEEKLHRLEHGTPDATESIWVSHRAVLDPAQRANALQSSMFSLLGIDTDIRCALDDSDRATLGSEIAAMSECIDAAINGRDNRIVSHTARVPSESSRSASNGSVPRPRLDSHEPHPAAAPLQKVVPGGDADEESTGITGGSVVLHTNIKASPSGDTREKHRALPGDAVSTQDTHRKKSRIS